MKRYILLFLVAFLSAGIISCTQAISPDARETVPPGPVSNVTYEAGYGGGILSYTIPADEDFLYVRAEFTIDNGMTISRTSSRFNNTLELTGMGVGPYEVKLYAVDMNGNESEPVTIVVQPLGATVDPISDTVEIIPGFGMFFIMLGNDYNTVVDICVDLWVDNKLVASRTYTSSATTDRVEVKGLDRDTKYTLDVSIRDNRYSYSSEAKTWVDMQILYDDTLNMKPLKIIDDDKLYGNQWDYSMDYPDNQNLNNYEGAPKNIVTVDGVPTASSGLYKFSQFRNARIRHNEASVYLFWDGRPDTHFETGDWDVGEGPDWPWCYFIDMGREIQLSRFRIWQPAPCAFGRMAGGCKSFEFWGSNDPDPTDGLLDDWTLIGKFTIKVPASEIDQQIEIEQGTEFQIDAENPQFSRTFRYWRFRGVSDWPVTTNAGDRYWASGRLSDIILLGKEVGVEAGEETTVNQ